MNAKQKKITIATVSLIVVLIVILVVGILIRNRSNSTQAVSAENIEMNVPEISAEDLQVDISEPNENGAVKFSIYGNLKGYPIYYAIIELIDGQDVDTLEDAPEEAYLLYESDFIIDTNSVIFLKYKRGEIFSPKPYKIVINNINSNLDENMTEEELEKYQLSAEEQRNSKYPYYIRVNYGANVVTVYKKDDKGEYTVPVKAMVCSCGTATPKSGVYKTTNKYVWRLLYGDVYGQFATRIVGSILFHSVPYTEQSKDTLEWWEYDKLGTSASAGCIRLTVQDTKWIYDNCASGTMVEFYSSSNPGPLGKPTAQKISGNTANRNWDPTDPDSRNPWKGGSGIVNTPSTPSTTPNEPVNPPVEPEEPADPVTPPTEPVDPPEEPEEPTDPIEPEEPTDPPEEPTEPVDPPEEPEEPTEPVNPPDNPDTEENKEVA